MEEIWIKLGYVMEGDTKEITFYDEEVEIGHYNPSCLFLKCAGMNFDRVIFEVYPNLDVVFNKIKHFNCEFNNISELKCLPSSLETLVCSYNRIRRLEGLPGGLKVVVASNNRIGFVDVREVGSLVELDLSYNELGTLKEVLMPKKMMALNLSHNRFREVDFGEEGVEMEYLSMNSNEIEVVRGLPEGLVSLELFSNVLSEFELPKGLENTLVSLNLTDNFIVSLRGRFLRLENLWISDNCLRVIENRFDRLRVLYCSCNRIGRLDLAEGVRTVNCLGNDLNFFRVGKGMVRVWIPLERVVRVTPFGMFMEKVRNKYVECEKGDVEVIAARMIQRCWRRRRFGGGGGGIVVFI
ncbi:MAG: hypothetical protein Hyperionvirus30_16 [Hyperionvirus sp.]|uniref:Leucine-rich repeat protein n=1 Tax=Hyperionvirus sp. TaxID=2487770 RepID=A0A3G5ABN3_9VIRU|nr:MAG: hypothetical protein Hyperionvirus30_16 [Hyperionvirus sp.]